MNDPWRVVASGSVSVLVLLVVGLAIFGLPEPSTPDVPPPAPVTGGGTRVPDGLEQRVATTWEGPTRTVRRSTRVLDDARTKLALSEDEASAVLPLLEDFLQARALRWRALAGGERVRSAELIDQGREARATLREALVAPLGATRAQQLVDLIRDPAPRH